MQKTYLGIEITSSAIRMASARGRSPNLTVEAVTTAEIQPGAACSSFSTPEAGDYRAVADGIHACLSSKGWRYRRAHLSLPDSLFRIQLLDFDEFPTSITEQERLVRWRLEKSAAFDLEGTVLRLHVQKKHPQGYTVLVCMAKQAAVERYEGVLVEAGLEPWSVGAASLHSMNLFAPVMSRSSTAYAFAYLSNDAFTTIVAEQGLLKFYRCKDVRPGPAGEFREQFLRELGDTMHFYFHSNRDQPVAVQTFFLAGDVPRAESIADELADALSLRIEVLTPRIVSPSASAAEEALAFMSAALGAGGAP